MWKLDFIVGIFKRKRKLHEIHGLTKKYILLSCFTNYLKCVKHNIICKNCKFHKFNHPSRTPPLWFNYDSNYRDNKTHSKSFKQYTSVNYILQT